MQRPGAMCTRPLVSVRESAPRRSGDALLVRELSCGVCRTDLDVAQGDLRGGWSVATALRLWPVSSDGKAMPLWPMVGVDETVSWEESV